MMHRLPRALISLLCAALLLTLCAATAQARGITQILGAVKAKVAATTAPAGPTTFASDDFERSVTNGWSSAPQGGSWTRTGSAANFGVASGTGAITMATAGQGPTSRLGTVASSDTDSTVTVKLDKLGNGSGIFAVLGARQLGNSGYRAKVKIDADGGLRLSLVRTLNNADTTLSSVPLPASAALKPNALLHIRLQAAGTKPTTLRARVWLDGTVEPATWQATATDSDATLQAAGGAILIAYLSAGSTNAPVTARFDGLRVQSIPATRVNVAPTATFTSSSTYLKADFDATTSTDPDGTIASYSWTYGDGTTGNGATPTHTYTTAGTYDTLLTVTDNDGATTTTTTKTVTVKRQNVAPTATFTSSSTYLKADFDATTSTDPDGTIASYSWTYGDGTTGNGATPTHTYTTAGTYDTLLTVTDNDGATTTTTKTVTVKRQNVAPTASFTSSVKNLTSDFAGSGSTDSDGTIASQSWSFGDGTTGSGASPTHTYSTAGTFDVKLTVTDNEGATDSMTSKVTTAAATTTGVDTLIKANFDNLPTGVISPQNFKATLGGTYSSTSVYDDTSIVAAAGRGNVIRTKLDKGTYKQAPAGNNGATLFIPLPRTVEQACINYDIRFSDGFDWSLGGKLPGLEGVAPGTSPGYPTGGNVAGDLGWSGRMMWLGPKAYSWAGPTNGAITYMYNPLQSHNYGDNVQWHRAFVAGTWHSVKVCYDMNTVGKSDGSLKAWMDGQQVINNTAYEYRNRNDVAVSHLLWHIFRGGHDANWAGATDGYVDIDDFSVTSTTP